MHAVWCATKMDAARVAVDAAVKLLSLRHGSPLPNPPDINRSVGLKEGGRHPAYPAYVWRRGATLEDPLTRLRWMWFPDD